MTGLTKKLILTGFSLAIAGCNKSASVSTDYRNHLIKYERIKQRYEYQDFTDIDKQYFRFLDRMTELIQTDNRLSPLEKTTFFDIIDEGLIDFYLAHKIQQGEKAKRELEGRTRAKERVRVASIDY